jgi:hypothetical protein
MYNTNPTSENIGLTEGTYNIVDNVHNKNTTQRTKKEASNSPEIYISSGVLYDTRRVAHI